MIPVKPEDQFLSVTWGSNDARRKRLT